METGKNFQTNNEGPGDFTAPYVDDFVNIFVNTMCHLLNKCHGKFTTAAVADAAILTPLKFPSTNYKNFFFYNVYNVLNPL